MLYGENSLFIGAILCDDVEEIERALGRRDELNRADWFIVAIDSYFDRRTAYAFGVNAAGIQFEGGGSSLTAGFRGNWTVGSRLAFEGNIEGEWERDVLAWSSNETFRTIQNRDEMADFEAFPKRDNFAFGSVQSNVVLRWEYRRGSALYAVWTPLISSRTTLNPFCIS